MKNYISRIILLLVIIMASTSQSFAQKALETQRWAFDNTSVGVSFGASTPLDFNSVFPLNTAVGIKFQKDFTPIFGFQLEGLATLNDNHFTDLKTTVKATNVGLNGAVNLSNLFLGYKGQPRTFEIIPVLGIGWLHNWDTRHNAFTGKTGVDLAFNLGKKKASAIVLTPAIYWNLKQENYQVAFNKHDAQLSLMATYVYRFKTSNGTHNFKLWDVGALQKQIEEQQAELDKKPTVLKEYVQTKSVETVDKSEGVIQFAQGSSELTNEAKAILDTVGDNLVVDIIGTASPEGGKKRNDELSTERAQKTADYLTKRGVRVRSAEGRGVIIGNSTNRLAIVTAAQ